MLRLLLLLTALTTSYAAAPLSLHMLQEVPVAGDATIKLQGKDADMRDELTYTITTLPSTGKLYQLSSVYSRYGYEPKAGTQITAANTVITDAKNRVLYVRPTPDRELTGDWDRFTYTASDSTTTSSAGTVTLTGPSNLITASDFSNSADGWTVTGNRLASSPANHEASSRGSLNHYIYATDDTLNMNSGKDEDLWYFNAPAKFLGWQGVVYGGTMDFTMSSFSGDFSTGNMNSDLKIVEMHCAKCATNSGITMSFPLSLTSFNGSTKTFSLPLLETSGWLQDPENTLKTWNAPTRCQFIELLGGLTSVKILGDFTQWYESVSVDNVKFVKSGSSSIPICAQGSPDASVCTC